MELLGKVTKEQFLKEYWQKKPLLIKGAFKDWENIISPDELAGLSIESDVESRIITSGPANDSYKLEQGPFNPERYESLGASYWSLLVQGVDRIHPEVSALKDCFSFIPNWRLDDVMVSYATDKGSVGPHIDNYDVFLVQGHGRREWKISSIRQEDDDFIEGLDIRVLKEFDETESYILEPGDMLYVPPRIPHWGIAIEESMTYSVGFRAPEHWELLSSFSSFLAEELNEDVLYNDPNLKLQSNPGEIKKEVFDEMKNIMLDFFSDDKKIASWFGRFITEPKMNLNMPPEQLLESVEELESVLSEGAVLVGMEGLKISYCESPVASLFVEGYELPLEEKDVELAKFLAGAKSFASGDLKNYDSESIDSVVLDLYNRGYFYLCAE